MSRSLNPPPGPVAAVFDRLFTWATLMFVCADQMLATWLRGFFFVWFNAEQPSPDETLSSWIGRGALEGRRAFRIAEKVIDFFLGEGHCRKAIGK